MCWLQNILWFVDLIAGVEDYTSHGEQIDRCWDSKFVCGLLQGKRTSLCSLLISCSSRWPHSFVYQCWNESGKIARLTVCILLQEGWGVWILYKNTFHGEQTINACHLCYMISESFLAVNIDSIWFCPLVNSYHVYYGHCTEMLLNCKGFQFFIHVFVFL